jgi:micrococcal nuclease
MKKLFLLIIVILFLSGCTATGDVVNDKNTQTKQDAIVTEDSNTNTDTKTEESAKVYYQVTSVVDGDTIKVDIDGKTETIRLIGIDTPETVDPRKVVQCFGKEASNKAKEWLSGKTVELEADASQGERDKYDRLLRYVKIKDGIFYNLEIIKQGYAHEYTYNTPYKYQSDFKAAEKYATDNKLGLWSDSTCSGDTSKAATTPTTVTTPPVIPPTVSTPPATNSNTSEPQVKKSNTDICHAKGTTYYSRTTNFTPYDTVEDCLDSGGRLPKR